MYKAYTLIEQLIVIIVVSMLVSVMLTISRPNDIKVETFKKAGKSNFIQIEFALKSLLAKNTNNYTLAKMVDATGEFSIAQSASQARMVALLKKHLVATRQTLDPTYGAQTLSDGATSLTGHTPAGYSGFIIKNGAYVGLKLHDNCTTTVDYLYDPSTPERNSRTNTCGIVFFDVNEKKPPNVLGIDQYIVAIGKFGVK